MTTQNSNTILSSISGCTVLDYIYGMYLAQSGRTDPTVYQHRYDISCTIGNEALQLSTKPRWCHETK